MQENNKYKYFIVTYTADNKNYCDKEFFERFNEIAKGCKSLVIDNTTLKEDYTDFLYTKHLKTITNNVEHLYITKEPKQSLFQRKVAVSVNVCREEFLKSDCDFMLIIESDVIPPINLLDLFDRAVQDTKIKIAANPEQIKNLGAIGALYYNGFHNYSLTGIHKVHHTLSGCTIYSREMLEKYPFRYNEESLAGFPDAYMCFDGGKDFSIWTDHDIRCQHLENRATGNRYSKPIE